MGPKKLIRFTGVETLCAAVSKDTAGRWKEFFSNDNPITLELACGKGGICRGAQLYPDRNFIGIDLKGNRIWVGAKKHYKATTNVAFIRSQIDQIAQYFAKNEVAEIWITFPDPQLRMSKAKRLTHPKFLRLYQQFLVPNGFSTPEDR